MTFSAKVLISGQSAVRVLRPNKLSLFASASVLVCGQEIEGDLVYLWTVYRGFQLLSLQSRCTSPA